MGLGKIGRIAVISLALQLSVPANAADDEDVAILAALGLTAATGKTEVKDKGGELESYILSSYLLKSAATAIVKDVPAGQYALLAENDKYDLSKLAMVRTRILWLREKTDQATAACRGIQRPSITEGVSTGFPSIAQAVTGALKTDTTLSGIEVSIADQMLLNAIAARSPGSFVVPAEATGFDPAGSALAASLFGIAKDLADLPNKEKCLADADRKASYKALVDTVDAMLAPGKDGAPSLLESALMVEALSAQNLKVLRVKIIKAGGSVVNRSNIWTTLGANGLTISGGLIATYRVVDPTNGSISKSGTVVCRTAARSMQQINGSVLKDKGGTNLEDATGNCRLLAG